MSGDEGQRVWPRVRAGLIALAVVVGMIDGCPIPKFGRRELEHPLQQVELVRWVGRLERMGIRTTPEALGEAVMGTGRRLARVQEALLVPFRPFQRLTQLRQRWKLFPVANPVFVRMNVEARGPDGEWELLFRPLDPTHDFLEGPLEYRRVRGSWDPGMLGRRGGYEHVVDWIAREVFRREPHFVEVRVRMEGVRVAAQGGYEPTGAFSDEELRRRDAKPTPRQDVSP